MKFVTIPGVDKRIVVTNLSMLGVEGFRPIEN